WLISCTLSGCSFAFSSCMNCYGERGCKSCIALSKPECAVCADDIFNKEDLETINGNQYMICDSQDPIQSKVCHLYCRGQFSQSGKCVRENNLPICKCSFESSTLSRCSFAFSYCMNCFGERGCKSCIANCAAQLSPLLFYGAQSLTSGQSFLATSSFGSYPGLY
ncbi:hypothetical protein BpHYR1_053963, partial [Brachionus plicatilis]